MQVLLQDALAFGYGHSRIDDPHVVQLMVQDPASRHLLRKSDTWEVTELEAMNRPESIDDHLHDDGRIGICSMLGMQCFVSAYHVLCCSLSLSRSDAQTAAREEARTTAQKLHEVRTDSTLVIARPVAS